MYRKIILPVDLNHDSSWQQALPVAVSYAKAFNAELHLMTVLPVFDMPLVGQYFPADFRQKARKAAQQQMEAFAKERVEAAIDLHIEIAEGAVYQEVVRVAQAIDADLIIMARHRPDLKNYLMGSNAEHVAHHAICSVLIVHDDHPL